MRNLNGGQSWRYIVKNYLWRYTSATSVFYYLNISPEPFTLDESVTDIVGRIRSAEEPVDESTVVPVVPVFDTMIVEQQQQAEVVTTDTTIYPSSDISEYEKRPLLALKTNLLFDLVSLVNLEVEVPIGKRWSVAGEWIFPWWTMDNGKADSPRNRLQLLNGNLEGKYWFGNRDLRPQMTGWFAGVYVGGGLYDLEHKAKGYQGEFFIMGGLSGGYAHTINKSGTLRMEYSLGLGYMQTNYRHY